MSYREVCVEQVREVLRAWLDGVGLRTVATRAGADRKTARRYVDAAEQVGVVRDGGAGQLDDAVIGEVVGLVRPVRPDGHGTAWDTLLETPGADRGVGRAGPDGGEDRVLLGRQGVAVPYRTLHRFCVECCGFSGRRPATTVRVADGEPGVECQIDFGELGLMVDPATRATAQGARAGVHRGLLAATC